MCCRAKQPVFMVRAAKHAADHSVALGPYPRPMGHHLRHVRDQDTRVQAKE